jgi:hypothetical protein
MDMSYGLGPYRASLVGSVTTLILLSSAFALLHWVNTRSHNGTANSANPHNMIEKEAVLVGCSEEESPSWMAEKKSMFRYMGEGHHLMFKAVKKASIPLFTSQCGTNFCM